jgi:hypothetical protein
MLLQVKVINLFLPVMVRGTGFPIRLHKKAKRIILSLIFEHKQLTLLNHLGKLAVKQTILNYKYDRNYL